MFLNETKEDVHSRAYQEGTSDPLKKFRVARWDVWHELTSEEKKEYGERAKKLRELVHKEGAPIEPPIKPAE